MASLTVGYSDSEDRVWVRWVSDQLEQRIWLTRRVIADLVLDMSRRLELSLVTIGPLLPISKAELLAFEQGEAGEALAATSVFQADPTFKRSVIEGGLCTIFEVTAQSEQWVIHFYAVSGPPLVFIGNRIQAHQLLKSLLNRQREASWNICIPAWLQ
jgi:hypothetical protein